MKHDDFLYEDSFGQTTKKAALGLVQFPYIAEDFREMLSHASELAYLIFGGILRLLMLILLPISAPLAAYMIRQDLARRKKMADDVRANFYADHRRLVQECSSPD